MSCPFRGLSEFIQCIADDDKVIECPIRDFCLNGRSELDNKIMEMINDCVNASEMARQLYIKRDVD